MNCPHHYEIYKVSRDPIKSFDPFRGVWNRLYRYEQSGELHGLTRVRGFTQDDAHIFCRPDQVKGEFIKVIDLVLLDFQVAWLRKNFTAQVSLRDKNNPTKYIGAVERWDLAGEADPGSGRRAWT